MKKQDKSWVWKFLKGEPIAMQKKLFLVILCAVIGLLLPSGVTAGGLEGDINTQLYNMFKQQGQANQAKWYAACNTSGRYVVVGKAPLPQSPRHVILAGPFNDEPSARAWVNSNCPSWKCDYNGRCLSTGSGSKGGGYGSSGGGSGSSGGSGSGGPIYLPPSGGDVGTGVFGQ